MRVSAFSTTFERPYILVVTGKADTRMQSLLTQLELSNHLATKDQIDIDKMLATDYTIVREKKAALRKNSFEFLESSLKGL